MKVGDKLFIQYYRGSSKLETVTKVGRKWIYLDSGYRFEKQNAGRMLGLDGDGYTSPGRVWMCEGDYRNNARAQALWSRIRDHVVGVFYSRKDHISIQDLVTVCRLLEIPLGELDACTNLSSSTVAPETLDTPGEVGRGG